MRNLRACCWLCSHRGSVANKITVSLRGRLYRLCFACAREIRAALQEVAHLIPE